MFLDPVKLLVIGVVALVVLGPERLPKVARTVGSLWHDFTRWRATIDEQVRSAFPDLPSTRDIATSVRSPLAFLDRMAQQSGVGTDVAEVEVPPMASTPQPLTTAPDPVPFTQPAAAVDPWDSWPTTTGGRPPASWGTGQTDDDDVVAMN